MDLLQVLIHGGGLCKHILMAGLQLQLKQVPIVPVPPKPSLTPMTRPTPLYTQF